jgi:hypothetical protein
VQARNQEFESFPLTESLYSAYAILIYV